MSRSMDILAHNLKRLRKEYSLTVEKVAEATGYAKSMISRYENGKTFPDDVAIDRFADLYKTSVALLFSPRGAAIKGAELGATEQNFLDAANGYLKTGEWELKKVKK